MNLKIFHIINAFDFQEVEKPFMIYILLPKNKKERDKHLYVSISTKWKK